MQSKTDETGERPQQFRLVDYWVYLGLRLLMCVIQMVSIERCDRYCRLAARLLTDWVPVRHRLIRDNLKLIFPDWNELHSRRIQREMWHHLLLMACEVSQAPRKIHRENWHDFFSIPDRHRVVEAILDPRPAIVVSGHFGNFELAGFLTGMFGLPSTTIARPLDNGYVHNFVQSLRSSGGQHYLPKDGSAPKIQELLNSGGTLTLLADQHGGAKGCWADFLGQPASCHKGLALFTLTSGAPMLVCCNVRKSYPMQFELSVLGVADPRVGGDNLSGVPALTRWYNACLEQAIRKTPGQYWWLHRRWRGDPPARRKKLAA